MKEPGFVYSVAPGSKEEHELYQRRVYFGNVPRTIIDLLKPSDDVLRKWTNELDRRWGIVANVPYPRSFSVGEWLQYFNITETDATFIKRAKACDLLRCLLPPPWLKRTCPDCSHPDWKPRPNYLARSCNTCAGHGTLPGPEVDPRWLLSNVVDLLRIVRGKRDCDCTKTTTPGRSADEWFDEADDDLNPHWQCEECYGALTLTIPDYSLLPILADALDDAGCDVPELVDHLRAEHHCVGNCWVIDAILKQ